MNSETSAWARFAELAAEANLSGGGRRRLVTGRDSGTLRTAIYPLIICGGKPLINTPLSKASALKTTVQKNHPRIREGVPIKKRNSEILDKACKNFKYKAILRTGEKSNARRTNNGGDRQA